jgi:hypothetical protein
VKKREETTSSRTALAKTAEMITLIDRAASRPDSVHKFKVLERGRNGGEVLPHQPRLLADWRRSFGTNTAAMPFSSAPLHGVEVRELLLFR